MGHVHQIVRRRHASTARDGHHRTRSRRRRVPRSSGPRVQHTGVPDAGTHDSAYQRADCCTDGCANCRTHRNPNNRAHQRADARADASADSTDTKPHSQPYVCAYATSMHGRLARLRQDGWWRMLRSRPEHVRVRLFGWL